MAGNVEGYERSGTGATAIAANAKKRDGQRKCRNRKYKRTGSGSEGRKEEQGRAANRNEKVDRHFPVLSGRFAGRNDQHCSSLQPIRPAICIAMSQ